MDKSDMIYNVCKENQKDIKEIIKIMPTLQTKKNCEEIRKQKKSIFSGNLKYIITTIIALSAILLAIFL